MRHCVNSNIGKWVETRADYQDISDLVCRVDIRGFIENEGVLSEASTTNLIGEIGGNTADPNLDRSHFRSTRNDTPRAGYCVGSVRRNR